jgi:hypothetical protein
LIKDKKGFQLHPEYNTDPSVYFIDGKIGQAETTKVEDRQQKELKTIGAMG